MEMGNPYTAPSEDLLEASQVYIGWASRVGNLARELAGGQLALGDELSTAG